MPLNSNGDYVRYTQDELQRRLKQELGDRLPADATAGGLVAKQLEAEAEVLAENQEKALQRVHDAAYLQDAEGKELDKVVDIIGITRRQPTSATGTIRLSRGTVPKTTYPISRGKTVQTEGENPVEFDITEKGKLAHLDGFEEQNLNNWEGDTSSFSVVASSNMTGSYALELPASSGVTITTKQSNLGVGATFGAEIRPSSGAKKAVRFGVQDGSNYFECVIDEGAQDLTLRLVEGGTISTANNNNAASIPAATTSYLELEWGLYQDSRAVLYESKNRDVERCSVTLADSTPWSEGGLSVSSLDATATCLIDEVNIRAALLNIEASEKGADTNIPLDQVTVLRDSISGVESVTNPVATGNIEVTDTDRNPLRIGDDKETDENLRDRAYESTNLGGAATVDAIESAIKGIEAVESMKLNRNRESTTVDGMPPSSFEAVVYGGAEEDIANAIFQTASIDSNDVGGVNGTKHTYQVQSDVMGGTEQISWSSPPELTLNIDLALVVDDSYVGDTEIRSLVVDFVGGTDVDSTIEPGLGVGEDLYEAVLKQELIAPQETGVWEVDNMTIDASGDGTDDTQTLASGAEALVVADNEIAITSGRDSSITITTTQR